MAFPTRHGASRTRSLLWSLLIAASLLGACSAGVSSSGVGVAVGGGGASVGVSSQRAVSAEDPLPSWNDRAAKQGILEFVDRVCTEGGDGFVPESERIAVFDNDGTLWSEQPMYFQMLFAIDRIHELAPEHPEWSHTPPFQAVLEGDRQALSQMGTKDILELVMASHTGMTTEEFEAIVQDWFATARHPDTGRPYTEMVFQPMLELLAYLRDHGFQTWIVSGGGIEYMRPWTEAVYGIPPEQVVGSTVDLRFEMRDGRPALVRQPGLHFLDDKEGKPVAIHRQIGRRPLIAFGNSDGDLQMLQWTVAGEGLRLAVLVHHTDAEREWAYDRQSSVGHLDLALDQARRHGWLIVDMKVDWGRIFTWETP